MLLKLDGVSTFYGDMQALYGVSFGVDNGEIVSVIGSNGAGKSTTLNTISGIFKPRCGSIRFKDQEIAGEKSHRIVEMGLIQIPEARRLFPFMSVMENLELGAFSAEGRAKKKKTLKRVFELFPHLEKRKKQHAGTMSGGEQQMLAIGRGIMARPRLLMLDEPSLGLAPLLVKQVFEVVKEIRHEGIAVLLVEQNVYHSLKVADRAYVLENGQVVLSGTAASLMEDSMVKKAYLGL